MNESPEDTTVLALTARVVAAHVGHNPVTADALPGLIRAVYSALNGLNPDREGELAEEEAAPILAPISEELVPAVPPEESVFQDHIICLEDGKKQKTLKRHLQSAHGLTPEAYRERWGLGPSYPMVAPDYAERRSELAKSIGLGTKRLRR